MGTFKNKIESLEMIPSSGGRYVITLDGEPIFDKKEAGRFPEWSEIQPHLERAAAQ